MSLIKTLITNFITLHCRSIRTVSTGTELRGFGWKENRAIHCKIKVHIYEKLVA